MFSSSTTVHAGVRMLAALCCGLTLTATLHFSAARAAENERSDVRLHAGTWNDVEKTVRAASGKVVIVDIWSTQCRPCMEEFPNLVRLSRKWPDHVVCVSFNVDYAGLRSRPPEYYRTRVLEFLQKSDAKFQNFLCTEESDAIYDRLKLPSIPAVLVYGTDGRLNRQFDARMQKDDGEEEPFNYREDIVPYVKRLLSR